MNALTNGPLSEEELLKLNDFLLATAGNSMDTAMLDGFLTAVVIGPKAILPSEWMRWVWDTEKGTDSPEFDSENQAREIIGMLIRHMNDIAQMLREYPQDYEPLYLENPNDGDPVPVIDEWCMGFMMGVNLDASGWALAFAEHPEWLETMKLYGTREGWDVLEERDLSLDAHKALAEGLADNVRNLYEFWFERRKADMAAGRAPGVLRREPIRNAQKVGRNEPCPCGSGKKYKHCHGAPGALH